MDDTLKVIINNYPDVFEGQVMINLLKSYEFFDTVAATVNSDDKKDFANGADNVLFSAIKLCRQTLINSPTATVKHQDMMAMLSVLSARGNISDTEFQIASARLVELLAADAMSPELIQPAVSHWLRKKRQGKLVSQAASGEFDFETLRKKIEVEVDAVGESLDVKTSFTFREAAKDSEEDDRPRHSTGLPAIDALMGGGVARKEFTLFVVPSGGGKTVLAGQLSQAFCGGGLKGIFITTEQQPSELVPRMVSAHCNVPFAVVKDGKFMNKLNPEQLVRYEELCKKFDENLIMEDWGKTDHDVVTEIPGLLRKCRNKLGRVDFVILDWIGGSLGAGLQQRLAEFRLVLKLASDSLGHHANKENIITVGFAQTNPVLSKNKRRVDRTMLGESKTMGDKATNIIGVSAIQMKEEEESQNVSYQEKQYAFLDKARKGTGGEAPLRRDFAYQRFTNWK